MEYNTFLPPFFFPYENGFHPQATAKWTGDNWNIAIFTVMLYALFIYYGPKYMEHRKPLDLKYPLAMWNLGLSIFSCIGAFRTVPYLLHILITKDYYGTICTHAYDSWGAINTTAYWTMLMNYSKIVELGDTVFVVLRKKPLIFLHWYHHITVLLFCWSAYSIPTGSGIYFCAMNYSVHAIMYTYYGCKALNCCPKAFPSSIITHIQTTQMFIGTFVCLSAWYYRASGIDCHNDIKNLSAGAIMYASYMYLFIQFARKRSLSVKEKRKAL